MIYLETERILLLEELEDLQARMSEVKQQLAEVNQLLYGRQLPLFDTTNY